MKKAILLGLPLLVISPLLLLVVAVGAQNIETVQAACANATTTTSPGTSDGSFRIGTLNWRGASHYARNPHPGERPYAERVPNMVGKIDTSGASIIGFQEFEPPQARAFLEATDGEWDIVRGRAHGEPDTRNAIAYQPSAWAVTDTRLVSINYGGNPLDIPLVRFTSTTGLGPVWVLNTHNPADVVNGSDAIRDSAVRTQANALRQLQTSDPSASLFLTGDMNDKARFKLLFLTVAGQGWSAANPTDDQIDWVMGSSDVKFSTSLIDESTNDNAHSYTDHPFVHTTVQVGATAADLQSASEPITGQPETGQRGSGQREAAQGAGQRVSDQSRSNQVVTEAESGAGPTSLDPPLGGDPALSAGTSASSVGSTPVTNQPSIPPADVTPTSCPPCPSATGLAVALSHVFTAEALLDAQVAAVAAFRAGFRGYDLVTAVAIAGVESTWDRRASNGSHFGLWQIGASHRGIVPGWDDPTDILDPLLNATYAHALYLARPGSGEAKFADWLPFEQQDYRQYLDLAREAVAVATGEVVTGEVELAGGDETSCVSSPTTVTGELPTELAARINAMLHTTHGLCELTWTNGAPCTYENQCPKVVDALYGGPGVGRGYGNGQDVAPGIINAGLAQAQGTGLDPLPPVGAVVSFNSGNGTGHVAIYVGGGKIFGNDYGCSANGIYGCVGFADVHSPAGSVTWALPRQAFDLGG